MFTCGCPQVLFRLGSTVYFLKAAEEFLPSGELTLSPVTAYRLPRPHGERPQERTGVLIAQKIRNIFCPHIGTANIVFRQQLPRVVQLLLEVRVFFLQFPLQGAFAVPQLCGHIFNGALPAGQQLHQGTADAGGIGIVLYPSWKAVGSVPAQRSSTWTRCS